MRALARSGMTMVVVTHELGFARDVSDRVVFMDEGRVIESESPEALMSNPREARTRDFLRSILQQGGRGDEGGFLKPAATRDPASDSETPGKPRKSFNPCRGTFFSCVAGSCR
jgi:ABC-type glutathione transport system ATPase component